MNAVARTEVKLQLRNAIGQMPMLTRIAANQPIHTNQDARSPRPGF